MSSEAADRVLKWKRGHLLRAEHGVHKSGICRQLSKALYSLTLEMVDGRSASEMLLPFHLHQVYGNSSEGGGRWRWRWQGSLFGREWRESSLQEGDGNATSEDYRRQVFAFSTSQWLAREGRTELLRMVDGLAGR